MIYNYHFAEKPSYSIDSENNPDTTSEVNRNKTVNAKNITFADQELSNILALQKKDSLSIVKNQENSDYQLGQDFLDRALLLYQNKQYLEAINACKKVLEIYPNEARAYGILGNCWHKLGKKTESLKQYAKALELKPDGVEFYVNIGSILAEQKKWNQALNYYHEALAINSSFAPVYRNLARLWAELDDREKAEDYLFQAIKLEPEILSPEQHFQLAVEYDSNGKRLQAIEYYRYAIQFKPDYKQAYEKLIELLEKSGRWQETSHYYRQLLARKEVETKGTATKQGASNSMGNLLPPTSPVNITINPNSQDVAIQPQLNPPQVSSLPPAKTIKNEYVAAKGQQNKQQYSNQVVILLNSARSYESKKQWLKAISSYLEALQLKPDLAIAYRALTYLYRQVENHEDSYVCLSRYYALKPSEVSAKDFLVIGDSLLNIESLGEAEACFRKAITIDSNAWESYFHLGQVLTKQKLWQSAVEVFEKAIAINPEHFLSHHILGEVLLELKQWQSAVGVFKAAIAIDQEFSWSHYKLGKAFMELKQTKEAAKALQRSIELKSDFDWAHHKLGDTLVDLEDWDGAIAAYRKALEITPNLPKTEEKLNDALRKRYELDRQQVAEFYQSAIAQEPEKESLYYKSLELDPHDVQAYVGLAQIKASQGDRDLAIAFYKIALQIQPDNREVLTALEKLQSQLS